MSDYLKPGDGGSFQDWTKQAQPRWADQECLRCQGYGGWNVQLYQYLGREHAVLAHLRKYCANCGGWGWTRAEDHVHVWLFHDQQTSTLYTERCIICHRVQQIDTTY